MIRALRVIRLLALAVLAAPAAAHDGPDPVAHWRFARTHLTGRTLKARLGPALTLGETPKSVTDAGGESLRFAGSIGRVTGKRALPRRLLTVAAWVSIEKPRRWGGIVGAIEDNGDYEKGWLLGYDDRRFSFALASKGSDDGNGALTYLRGATEYRPGVLYHVVATYDGATMRLFVNGKVDGHSTAQSGDILYPTAEKEAPWTVGGYLDSNERHPHAGRLRDVAIYDRAAEPAWVRKTFAHHRALAALPPHLDYPDRLGFLVRPYLQRVTRDGITVMWETTRPSRGEVAFGATAALGKTVASPGPPRTLHEVRLSGLPVQTQHFYRVRAIDGEQQIRSSTSTFATAVKPDTPFAFAVISDTQTQHTIAGRIAALAWRSRPHFVLHPGDLVGRGTTKAHWTRQFFPALHPLISRIALFPVLGNHEQDARHYYDYMSLPAPEYHYSFRYGNTDVFCLDTNRAVGPGSEQYAWLDKALAASTATWKIVCHHHPPYSSDGDDYGDLWKTNRSTRGDLRVRTLTPLYDKHAVDIVWTGHIHSYERTWPLRAGKPVEKNGTLYMVTGGGGGHLEHPAPHRAPFANVLRRDHHYCIVSINGRTLELRAHDLSGRLFDRVVRRKPAAK